MTRCCEPPEVSRWRAIRQGRRTAVLRAAALIWSSVLLRSSEVSELPTSRVVRGAGAFSSERRETSMQGKTCRQLAAIALLGATVLSQDGVRAEEGVGDDTIKIGGLGALTGPGYLYGKIVMDGAEAIYKEVNDAGGIAGRKIVYMRQD